MLPETFRFAIVCLVGIGYFILAIVLRYEIIVRFCFILCSIYLIAYGLFLQSNDYFLWIAIAALILPFITHYIFHKKKNASNKL